MDDRYIRLVIGCLIILSATAITGALIFTRIILAPFAIAFLIYLMLSPLTRWLRLSLKLPRIAAVTLTMIAFLVSAGAIIIILSLSIGHLINSFHLYSEKITKFFVIVIQTLTSWGIPIHHDALMQRVNELPFIPLLQNIGGGIFLFSSKTALVIIVVFFFIAGDSGQKRNNPLWTEIYSKISRYITIKCIISLINGIIVGTILWVFNVDFAFMFGIVTFLLNFIPNFGPVIATILLVPVIAFKYGFEWQFFCMVSIILALHFLVSSIVEPKIFGERLKLHPVVVIFSLLFWGMVWGLPGLFLAVPLMSIVKIVACQVMDACWISDILEGHIPGSNMPLL